MNNLKWKTCKSLDLDDLASDKRADYSLGQVKTGG